MAEATKTETATSGQGTGFTTTHWSLILNAQDTTSPLAIAALEKLCRAYWYPLYVYVRRQGEDEESAKDLTEGFFARLLEKRYLGQVQREKGKFRSFLLAALNSPICTTCGLSRKMSHPAVSSHSTYSLALAILLTLYPRITCAIKGKRMIR